MWYCAKLDSVIWKLSSLLCESAMNLIQILCFFALHQFVCQTTQGLLKALLLMCVLIKWSWTGNIKTPKLSEFLPLLLRILFWYDIHKIYQNPKGFLLFPWERVCVCIYIYIHTYKMYSSAMTFSYKKINDCFFLKKINPLLEILS